MRRIAEEIAIHCLDLMYFHFNQPLAPQSLRRFVVGMQREDRAFVLAAHNLLTLEDDIVALLASDAFALPSRAASAFYLDHHRRYRALLPKLLDLAEDPSPRTDGAPP